MDHFDEISGLTSVGVDRREAIRSAGEVTRLLGDTNDPHSSISQNASGLQAGHTVHVYDEDRRKRGVIDAFEIGQNASSRATLRCAAAIRSSDLIPEDSDARFSSVDLTPTGFSFVGLFDVVSCVARPSGNTLGIIEQVVETSGKEGVQNLHDPLSDCLLRLSCRASNVWREHHVWKVTER